MSGSSFAPQTDRCPFKSQLITQLQEAHDALLRLDNQEMEFVLRGDLAGCAAIGDRLKQARQQRDAAVQLLKKHIEEHHC